MAIVRKVARGRRRQTERGEPRRGVPGGSPEGGFRSVNRLVVAAQPASLPTGKGRLLKKSALAEAVTSVAALFPISAEGL